jgi:NADH dehydrogenase FAD-containing subunit
MECWCGGGGISRAETEVVTADVRPRPLQVTGLESVSFTNSVYDDDTECASCWKHADPELFQSESRQGSKESEARKSSYTADSEDESDIADDLDDWFAPAYHEWPPRDERPHVFIIGAGFGGMKAARQLKDSFRVTICDCKDYFQFGPGIMRAFVKPDHFDNVVFPVRPVIEEDMGCSFLWGEVFHIDPVSREVQLHRLMQYAPKEGSQSHSMRLRRHKSVVCSTPAKKMREAETVKFDYLIVAAGCAYTKIAMDNGQSLWFPTVLGSQQKASPWKHHDERTIEGRRHHILEEYRKLQKMNEQKSHVVVAGAGFIGVEWAMELKHEFEDIGITIVSRPREILTRWPKEAIQYAQNCLDKQKKLKCVFGTTYDPEDPRMLQKLKMKTPPAAVYSCTGVQSSVSFLPRQALTTGQGEEKSFGLGWVRVNRKLQVCIRAPDGSLQPWCMDEDGNARVFAVGDCAYVVGIPRLPKQCYPAEEQGVIVSRVIEITEGLVTGEPERVALCGPQRSLPDSHWPWGSTMVVLSLGGWDGCFVFNATHEEGTGLVGLWSFPAGLLKWFLEVTSVDNTRMGLMGRAIWYFVHNTPVHLWGGGPLCGY